MQLQEAEQNRLMELQAGMLSVSERAEYDALLAAGFGHWSRKDFQLFTRALESFGRKEKSLICHAGCV